VPLVRCQKHGRVYDSDEERGCPQCLAEGPHRRGAFLPQSDDSPTQAASRGRLVLLLLLLGIVVVGAGAYWYFSTHTAERRAQEARDSLRALAAGPPRPDTSRFAKATDFSPIRRARALKANLEGLIRANRSTVLGMATGPIDTTVTNRAARTRARQYAAFVRRWHSALESATRGGTEFRYEPGVQYSLQMDQVSNSLGAAAAVLRGMVPQDSVNPRSTRQADLTTATGYLNNAGTVLTSLPATAPTTVRRPSRTTVRRPTTRR